MRECSNAKESKLMTDESNEVAPLETAETDNQSDLLTFQDIAEEAGFGQFFENREDGSPDQATVTEAEEATEEPEVETTEEPQPIVDTDTEGVKKRIGKLVEAREKAREEADALKAEIEKLRSDKPKIRAMTGLEKFDDVANINDLQKREEDAEHLREWLLQNPDGGEYVDQSGEEHEVDYEKAKNLIVETDRDLRKNIPFARQRMIERQRQDATALNTFKWMGNKSTEEYYKLNEILQNNEYLSEYAKKDPYAMVVLGYAVEGYKTVHQKQVQKPSVQNSAPKVPVAPSNAKPKVIQKPKTEKAELLQKARSGRFDDAVSYIESIL